MPTNDDPRLQLRPQIATQTATSPTEDFQNRTLRPILKLQHELLLEVMRHHLRKRKVYLEQLTTEKRREKIKELLTRDNRIRGLLFGMVIGQFTPEELAFYLANESPCKRRITNLLHERILSVLG